jgi:PelA/Pel-15E family pectate lyase
LKIENAKAYFHKVRLINYFRGNLFHILSGGILQTSFIQQPNNYPFRKILFLTFLILTSISLSAQNEDNLKSEITSTIYKATNFFDENIGIDGAYVWFYTTDLSRRWGEMEAYPSMAWVQGPGTVAMGNTFLDIYETTGDEYYYKLADKSAKALIKGQLACGGWNYFIDFAGEQSIKKWYNTIGKNGWRLEEFQHYYGNATFDDAATPGAATFLLRFYLVKKDADAKAALDKAIKFILEAQYQLGGWPQRFPLTDKFNKNGNPDYTPYFTFNDNAIWNNIKFLIECYETLGDKKLLTSVKKAMDFYLITQQPEPQAGWAQQYSLDLKPAAARTYEPKALDPQYTARHIEMLIKFYEITGEEKYLKRIPEAIKWIESVKISDSQNGFYKLPKFVEIGTNKPIFTHRVGTNVKCGRYFFDYDSSQTLVHYMSSRLVNMKQVYDEVENARSINVVKNGNGFSIPGCSAEKSESENFNLIDGFMIIPSDVWNFNNRIDSNFVRMIISRLDENGRWLVPHAFISNPYIGEPECSDPQSKIYSHTRVGDKYDTSPFEDTSDQKYISTGAYIRNVNILLDFLNHSEKMRDVE